MSELAVVLEIRYTPVQAGAMARAWAENALGLLFLVKSHLSLLHLAFLAPTLAHLRWAGGPEPAVVLRWVHDRSWVRARRRARGRSGAQDARPSRTCRDARTRW
jgi:hypothetical protein